MNDKQNDKQNILKKNRPININPFSIRLPLPALISISHRLSGLFIFLSIPFILWALSLSLESQRSFENLQSKLITPINKILIWLFLAALIFHLLAGIRHILMDLGIGESLKGARFLAWLVLLFFVIKMGYLTLVMGGVL